MSYTRSVMIYSHSTNKTSTNTKIKLFWKKEKIYINNLRIKNSSKKKKLYSFIKYMCNFCANLALLTSSSFHSIWTMLEALGFILRLLCHSTKLRANSSLIIIGWFWRGSSSWLVGCGFSCGWLDGCWFPCCDLGLPWGFWGYWGWPWFLGSGCCGYRFMSCWRPLGPGFWGRCPVVVLATKATKQRNNIVFSSIVLCIFCGKKFSFKNWTK